MNRSFLFFPLLGLVALGTVTFSPLVSPPDFQSEQVDFARLEQGARIAGVSSVLNAPAACRICADPRDVIGGKYSQYYSGETGTFLFDVGDFNQSVTVDLGRTRVLDRVGAFFSDGTNDREVFDFLEISASLDGVTFVQQGQAGLKGIGDPLDYTLTSPVYFDLSPPKEARFVRYDFGQHSPDWGGGSRIFEVLAEGTH